MGGGSIATTALPNIGRSKSYALKGLSAFHSATDSTDTTKTTATKSCTLAKGFTSEAGNFLENASFRVRFQLWRGTA
jgi:hypothetical protein